MIYIVRHGQTDYNLNKIYQGQKDIELNDTGINQAHELKEKLDAMNFDVVISSPLKRAYKTAEILNKGNILTDTRLMERGFGKLEGLKFNDTYIDVKNKQEYEKQMEVESDFDFRKRVSDFWVDIKEKYKDKKVLIVTHNGFMIRSQCYFYGEPENADYSKYKISNCEVLEINI